jgi:hypothetical protein
MFDNFATQGRGATTTSNSVASESFLPEFLEDQQLDRSWRSGSLAEHVATRPGNIFVTIDLASGDAGAPRTVRDVTIHRHNIREPWRILLYRGNPATSSAVYFSEFTKPVITAKFSDFTFEEFRWRLGPTDEDLDTWTDAKLLDSFIQADKAYTGITHVRIEISVENIGLPWSTQRQDYFQFAMPLVGQFFQPPKGVNWGWSVIPEDRSIVDRSPVGAVTGRDLGRARKARVTFSTLTEISAFEDMVTRLSGRIGKLGKVFVMTRPSSRRIFYSNSFIATATKLPGASERVFERFESSMDLMEAN